MAKVVIDAHQHFWDPATGSCSWMTEDFASIRRVFTPADLAPELAANGVDATVLVQTWASLDETQEFLELAANNRFVAGVVGWVDLTHSDVASVLAALKGRPDGRFLVGIRHLVHNEADPDWLLRNDVRRGLAAVERAGLTYDLLLREREIPAALKTVADFPDMRFVVDHIAKPDIRNGAIDSWRKLMREFQPHRDHVWCKLSGMVTEADWKTWQAVDLAPYVREVLSIFGASRCMFGSDWPVCLVAGEYRQIKAALEQLLDGLTPDDRDAVFGQSAIAAYQLPDYVSGN
ncbi:MAG: amidohydrolase family protein [Propionivibrio sp.]